jgi:Peptidase A4 family
MGVTSSGCTGNFTYQGVTTSLSYLGGYTGEWIVEDYQQGGIGGPLLTLADFGSVAFTGLDTSLSSWSLTADEGLAIVQEGTVLATPSPPSSDGFSVTYTG